MPLPPSVPPDWTRTVLPVAEPEPLGLVTKSVAPLPTVVVPLKLLLWLRVVTPPLSARVVVPLMALATV